MEQYLTINNLEIVILPKPEQDETNEDVILNSLNYLEQLAYEDIGVSQLGVEMGKEFQFVYLLVEKLNKTF